MSEKPALKESWSTDLSPTTHLLRRGDRVQPSCDDRGAGEVYPGWWRTRWPGGCYTGYYPATFPDPYLTLIWPQGPTYGRMKAIPEV